MLETLLKERGLSLDRLQTFAKVAAAKGVLKAAGGDAVTQSMYSRQIKELESFFGAQLMNRSSGGVALTAAGEELYDHVSQIFNTLTEFKARCQTPANLLSFTPAINFSTGTCYRVSTACTKNIPIGNIR